MLWFPLLLTRHCERHLVVIPRSSRSSAHSWNIHVSNVGALAYRCRTGIICYVPFFFSFRGKSLTLLHAHVDTENPSVKHTEMKTTHRVILPQNFGEINAKNMCCLFPDRRWLNVSFTEVIIIIHFILQRGSSCFLWCARLPIHQHL